MQEQIESIIYKAIDEINEISNLNIKKNIDAELYGKNSNLDSLGLVNLIVGVEEGINNTFNVNISLADEKAMSQKNSPFRNVSSLTAYIQFMLEQEN